MPSKRLLKTQANVQGASEEMGLSQTFHSFLKRKGFDPDEQLISTNLGKLDPECCVCDSETDRDHSELIPGFGEVCQDCLAEIATETRDNHPDVFRETVSAIRKRMGTNDDTLLN